MRLHYLVSVAIAISEAFSTVIPTTTTASTHNITVSFPRNIQTKRFGDNNEERAGGGTISVSTSEKLAALFKSSKVTDEQLQKWLEKGKSAEDVFYRMKLAKSRTWIFDNLFSKWVQYAGTLGATASGNGTSAILILTARYGDDDLYKILKAAERDAKSNELASRLRTDQVNHWIAIAKDPVEVYQLYDLRYASHLLQNPQFSAWIKYVDDLHAKHEGAISIITTLRKYYKDAQLFKMAELAKRVRDTKTIGLKMDDAFVQFWINERKTPVGILGELRLEATTKMMESPLFSLLVKFTDAYDLKFPQTKTTMIETLTNAFGDEKVTKMLTAVKTSDWKAKKVATELEAAQLKMWSSSGRSVDDVYDLLKLPSRRLHNNFAGNPVFKTWIAYMNTFSIENPDKVARLLSALATQFEAERPMIQILQAAKKFPSMERDAAKLQLQLTEKVFATGISPYKTFTRVALDSEGDSVLSSPVFTKWMNYVDDFNRKNPGKEESWFSTLHNSYQSDRLDTLLETARGNPTTAKIADTVEKARMEWWLSGKYEPKDTFRFLRLDEHYEMTFSSSSFELWVKYLNDFNHKNPDKKTTMIDSIRANYKDPLLIQLLDEAETITSTQKLAKNLQSALINQWVDEGVTVAYLKKMIGHVPSSNDWIERYTKVINTLS